MSDFLPAIAFAHNSAFNSAINCTPFEAGHGLRARTITEARANPRLQITAEEGTDIQEPDNTWEASIFPKVCRLAERLVYDALRHSQWHKKRMNAHNLNRSGAKIRDKGLEKGNQVYFYPPPSQHEIIRRGRKAKHLAHYHGPATIQGKVEGRDRQYHLSFEGKSFKRDVSMLVPKKYFTSINPKVHESTPPMAHHFWLSQLFTISKNHYVKKTSSYAKPKVKIHIGFWPRSTVSSPTKWKSSTIRHQSP